MFKYILKVSLFTAHPGWRHMLVYFLLLFSKFKLINVLNVCVCLTSGPGTISTEFRLGDKINTVRMCARVDNHRVERPLTFFIVETVPSGSSSQVAKTVVFRPPRWRVKEQQSTQHFPVPPGFQRSDVVGKNTCCVSREPTPEWKISNGDGTINFGSFPNPVAHALLPFDPFASVTARWYTLSTPNVV